jgi:hypothetical protein
VRIREIVKIEWGFIVCDVRLTGVVRYLKVIEVRLELKGLRKGSYLVGS